ncbi:MAG TPA: hypothetical protein VEY88_21910 [Archangium sp.]|nr:hypothetical protein [Archangium sp.]
MRFSSFRSLMMAAVLPLGLAACGPEIDQNTLQAPWDVAPQVIIRDQDGKVLPWDVQAQVVIRDRDPGVVIRDVQAQLVIRDPNGKLPWDVAPQGLVIRD